MKGGDDRGESAVGVGTKVAAKAPINTLITAWQEQAVPVKDTLGHWRVGRGVGGGGGGVAKSFPRAGCNRRTSESKQEDGLRSMPWL